jgi:hypothetical protein
MASINESREAEPGGELGSNAVAASDDLAAQLARIVFEWRPTLTPALTPTVNALWMSRNVRR